MLHRMQSIHNSMCNIKYIVMKVIIVWKHNSHKRRTPISWFFQCQFHRTVEGEWQELQSNCSSKVDETEHEHSQKKYKAKNCKETQYIGGICKVFLINFSKSITFNVCNSDKFIYCLHATAPSLFCPTMILYSADDFNTKLNHSYSLIKFREQKNASCQLNRVVETEW